MNATIEIQIQRGQVTGKLEFTPNRALDTPEHDLVRERFDALVEDLDALIKESAPANPAEPEVRLLAHEEALESDSSSSSHSPEGRVILETRPSPTPTVPDEDISNKSPEQALQEAADQDAERLEEAEELSDSSAAPAKGQATTDGPTKDAVTRTAEALKRLEDAKARGRASNVKSGASDVKLSDVKLSDVKTDPSVSVTPPAEKLLDVKTASSVSVTPPAEKLLDVKTAPSVSVTPPAERNTVDPLAQQVTR